MKKTLLSFLIGIGSALLAFFVIRINRERYVLKAHEKVNREELSSQSIREDKEQKIKEVAAEIEKQDHEKLKGEFNELFKR